VGPIIFAYTVDLQFILEKRHSVYVRHEQDGVADVGALYIRVRVIDLDLNVLAMSLDEDVRSMPSWQEPLTSADVLELSGWSTLIAHSRT
jgi:hypothetical protein